MHTQKTARRTLVPAAAMAAAAGLVAVSGPVIAPGVASVAHAQENPATSTKSFINDGDEISLAADISIVDTSLFSEILFDNGQRTKDVASGTWSIKDIDDTKHQIVFTPKDGETFYGLPLAGKVYDTTEIRLMGKPNPDDPKQRRAFTTQTVTAAVNSNVGVITEKANGGTATFDLGDVRNVTVVDDADGATVNGTTVTIDMGNRLVKDVKVSYDLPGGAGASGARLIGYTEGAPSAVSDIELDYAAGQSGPAFSNQVSSPVAFAGNGQPDGAKPSRNATPSLVEAMSRLVFNEVPQAGQAELSEKYDGTAGYFVLEVPGEGTWEVKGGEHPVTKTKNGYYLSFTPEDGFEGVPTAPKVITFDLASYNSLRYGAENDARYDEMVRLGTASADVPVRIEARDSSEQATTPAEEPTETDAPATTEPVVETDDPTTTPAEEPTETDSPVTTSDSEPTETDSSSTTSAEEPTETTEPTEVQDTTVPSDDQRESTTAGEPVPTETGGQETPVDGTQEPAPTDNVEPTATQEPTSTDVPTLVPVPGDNGGNYPDSGREFPGAVGLPDADVDRGTTGAPSAGDRIDDAADGDTTTTVVITDDLDDEGVDPDGEGVDVVADYVEKATGTGSVAEQLAEDGDQEASAARVTLATTGAQAWLLGVLALVAVAGVAGVSALRLGRAGRAK